MNTGTPELALRDIHLPEPISWWPPAPGWWLVAIACLLLGLVIWQLYRQRQHNQSKRDSISTLAELRARFNQEHNSAKLLRELSVLLRRSCITFYPRRLSASLTGEHWLAFLDATSPRAEFSQGIGKVLAHAPYLPDGAQAIIDNEALLKLCEDWLRAQPNKNYLAGAAQSDRNAQP